MHDIRSTLSQILSILKFPEDQRDSTMSGIIALVNEYVLVSLMRRLDKEIQLEFKELIQKKEDQQAEILSFIKKYYTTDAVNKTVAEEGKKLICDYLKTLSPMMHEEEKEEIKSLLDNCFE
ncbi:hypothetical protein A2011_00610 [candidate division CPR3 bacterium GWE2_35_7]|nr:MAG: hypothetical protein UR87_C0019G0003 [candidate division CPR3 bacterium GW2011_GWE2_35_7]OGB80346.1 MAG: hypothetical protein A2011_00610 [candidate division CPR3 bacterium GWE2_35_7]